jgi:hypothetical protein
MAAKKTSTRAAAPIPPYGAPINDAIKKGDQASMKRLLASSKKYHADLGKAIDKLEAALNK